MKSIRAKFLFLNLISVLLCAVLVGGVSLAAISNSQLTSAREILTLTCRAQSAEFEELLYSIRSSVDLFCELADEQLDSLDTLSDDEAARQLMAQVEQYMGQFAKRTLGVCAYYFRAAPELTTEQQGFFYSKKTGASVLISEPLTDLSQYSPEDTEYVGWYYRPQEAGHAIWLEPYYNRNLNMYLISYVAPLYRDGQFWAIAGMDIDFTVVLDQLRSLSPYATGFAALMSDEGTVYYHPHVKIGHPITDESEELQELLDRLASPEGEGRDIGTCTYHHRGVGMELSYSRLQNGMVLLLCAERREIKAPLVSLFKVVAVLIVLICAAMVAVLLVISNRITRPLEKLTHAANEIARGNMDVELPEPGKDEVGLLTKSFAYTVTSLKKYLGLMYNMAYSDALTQVKNKTAYDKACEDLQAQLDRGEADFGLLMLDLNNLKHINDRYGHEHGDDYLLASCHLICTVFRHSPVYRVGGDEFVVLLGGEDKLHCAERLAELEKRMADTQTQPKPWQRLSIAKGVAFCQPGDSSPEDVFKRADAAMYADKRRMKQK